MLKKDHRETSALYQNPYNLSSIQGENSPIVIEIKTKADLELLAALFDAVYPFSLYELKDMYERLRTVKADSGGL